MPKAILSEGKTVLKNILIGVLTTVIGATIIYFIGFNQKNSYSKDERGEITAEAWKTLTTVENIYIKNRISLLSDVAKLVEFSYAFNEIKEESGKFQSSLADLADNEGLDRNMVNALKKRLDDEKKEWPKTEALFKELDVIDAKRKKESWTKERALDIVGVRLETFLEELKSSINTQAGNIEELSQTLAKQYSQAFDPDNFLSVQARKYKKDIFSLSQEKSSIKEVTPDQPGIDAGNVTGEPAKASLQYFAGKWEAGSAIVIFGADGKASWFSPANNTEAKGSWQLKNQQLIVNIKKHPVSGKAVIWTFDFSNLLTNSCTITNTAPPYTVYHLMRSNQ